MNRKIKMIAVNPLTRQIAEVFPWSGIEIADMDPRFLFTKGDGGPAWMSVPGTRAIDAYAEWVQQWTPQEIKARRLMAGRSLDQLIQDFDQTDDLGDQDTPDRLATAIVRGWIMDELEYRDRPAFDAWMMTSEGSPRRFFTATIWVLERKLCDASPASDIQDAIWTGVCSYHAADGNDALKKALGWARYQSIARDDVRVRPATEAEAVSWMHDEWMD